MSVTLKDAGLRRRDVFWTAAIAIVIVSLVISNAIWAKTKTRTRICVVAAHLLPAGTMLRDDDLRISVRRIDPNAKFFDRPEQLLGRQLDKDVERNHVLKEDALVESCLERMVTFTLVVDGQAAANLARYDQVILTRTGKQDAIPTMPIFTVINVSDVPSTDASKIPDRRLELRANYAADAIRVFAGAGDSPKFIPLRLRDQDRNVTR